MENKEIQNNKKKDFRNKKKDFLGTILCVSILIIFLLILIIVNPKGISNSLETIPEDSVINYMKDNNITIYGGSKCSYCQKQLKEFKPYETEALEERVFVFCDLTQDTGCIGVEGVPAWKINNEIVHVGYLPLNEIENVLYN